MPFLVIKSKTIKWVALVACVAILLTISFYGGTCAEVFFGHSSRLVPIYNVDTQEKVVALSYDAAWGADKTEDILQVLKENDANATFFLVGNWVDKYPQKVKAISDAGCEIGTHSDTHPDLVKCSESTIREELERSKQKITDLTGKPVQLFRAPYGSYNNTVISIASGLGLTTIQWNIDTLDWKGLSANDVNTRVNNALVPGSIILMHNNADNVVQSTKIVLQNLKARGFKVVPVGQLIYTEGYTIDHTGKQIKK